MQFSDLFEMDQVVRTLGEFYNEQPEIVNGFENSKESSAKYLKFIDSEIDDLNSFKQKLLDNKENPIVFDLASSSKELLQMYKLKEETQGVLNLEKPVSVKSDGVIIVKEPAIIKSMVIWAILFGFLSLIFALILELERESKKRNL